MAADSKTEKKLGHNMTVTRTVLLPKTRLWTTTGQYNYCKAHTSRTCFAGAAVDRAGSVGRGPEAL